MGDFNDELHRVLAEHGGADLVLLLGFLSPFEPRSFAGRILNVHPALIPAFSGKGFYGRRVHEAVLAKGCKVSGATVHFADGEYDHGPIVLQQAVPVLEDDTPSRNASRPWSGAWFQKRSACSPRGACASRRAGSTSFLLDRRRTKDENY